MYFLNFDEPILGFQPEKSPLKLPPPTTLSSAYLDNTTSILTIGPQLADSKHILNVLTAGQHVMQSYESGKHAAGSDKVNSMNHSLISVDCMQGPHLKSLRRSLTFSQPCYWRQH